MKKLTFILALLMATGLTEAQTIDSITYHYYGSYGPDGWGIMENIAQMSDGNVLFVNKVGINWSQTENPDIVGNVLYKVSRHGAVILDTLVVRDNDPSYYLFAKNPDGDDNLRIGIVHDSTTMSSFLQIFPFDSDMNYDTLNEVFVPLSDTIALSYPKGYLINNQNDLVMAYRIGDEYDDNGYQHFASFGLDGTLKHESVMPVSDIPMKDGYLGMGVFNESPLEYYCYGINRIENSIEQYLACYVLDSLLQYKESFTVLVSSVHPQMQYNFGWNECLLVDGDDFILGSRYKQGAHNGVCLVRYDKYTLEKKNVVMFESQPMMSSFGGYGACPIGLGMGSEGFLYFAYNTQVPFLSDLGQIAVVKMDADFNVQWQRFYSGKSKIFRHPRSFALLDDDGVAVSGDYTGRPEIFMLIFNDDYDGMEEQGIIVRPYAYWPNPAQDELHLHYSPDVTPTQIELYDLQGRLVRTQRNGLENLEMNGLPSGAYMMRVTLEDGKVFSDKVIRE